MKVVVAEPINEAFNSLVKESDVSWDIYDEPPKDKEELIKRLKDAEVATSFSVKYDAEVFEACPNLKFLAIPAVGANFFVDMNAAHTYGVTVMNCPGYNAQAVAELAVGLAIMVARKVPSQQHELRKGLWHGDSHGFQLAGKKVGMVGNGNVGQAIQSLLSGWSTDINVLDSKSTHEEVDTVLADSQVIFVCCPLTDSTKNLISKERIESMQDSAIIVNVGRGAVIDQEALYTALANKRIYGAGLDVFAKEPAYGSDLSEEVKQFYNLDNALVTPHIAGNSFESSDQLSRMIFDNLKSAEDGQPINVYSA